MTPFSNRPVSNPPLPSLPASVFRAAVLPPPLASGDRVGIAALSGPVDEDRLKAGLATLEGLGFRPVAARNLLFESGLFAGTDEERLEGFHRLAADPSIKAIFFARGGHGVLRLLDRIDWQLLQRHPRAYVGYSDLTPFLLEVVRRLGLVAFHGPMVAAELARQLSEEEGESLLACLGGDFPRTLACRPMHGEGVVEGPVLGGCLSLLTSLVGTPYCPSFRGSILFWEEVAEPPYRIDRMLTHLHLSDTLTGIVGMVIGHLTWPSSEEKERAWGLLADDVLSAPPWPVATGLACGHDSPNLTLPLGITGKLDLDSGSLVLG